MKKKKTRQEIQALKKARVLIKHDFDTKAAYKEITGNPDDKNAQANANKLFTEQVLEQVKKLLNSDKVITDRREAIERGIQLVMARYMTHKEQGSNFIAALKLLKEIDPEMGKNKVEFDDVSKMDEKKLDEEIDKYKKLLGE